MGKITKEIQVDKLKEKDQIKAFSERKETPKLIVDI